MSAELSRSAWFRASGASIALLVSGCASRNAQVDEQQSKDVGSGWRTEFAVNKADLGSTGTNPYFPLQPGRVQVYRNGDAMLTVTVTDQTRRVDGVETRIVEEREEKHGKVVEVSRNFFAADRKTGDVFYFGEEVDEYKNGQIASHGGAWQSGVNNARFGLFMPGKPAVGDKFYQEQAKEAQDRAEIVSLTETVQTPAGEFKNCVHVRETTPLEMGVSHKWYSPEAGQVRDDGMKLAETKPGKP